MKTECTPRFNNGSLDSYVNIGYALELLNRSPYHRNLQVGLYFHKAFFPALKVGQVRFYLTEDGLPIGMITWAWLSEAIEGDVHQSGRGLAPNEWQCGERLFINDLIAPFKNARQMIREMMVNVVPGVRSATSLRRNLDGSVRRVNRWTRPNHT